MSTLVILYAGQPSTSFLRKLLCLDTIQTLRIGNRTYVEFFTSLECFTKTNLVLRDTVFPADEKYALERALQEVSEHATSIADLDRLMLLDISFYPLDSEWLSHLLLKAEDTDIPLCIYAGTARGKRLAGVCLQKANAVQGKMGEEKATCVASPSQLADLLDPAIVLKLFSSNFSLRHFNSLKVTKNVYFFKWSCQTEKMQAEYSFLKQVPSQVRPYFPHVGDFLESKDGAGYEVEIIPLLDVSKALLNGLFLQEEHCLRFVDTLEQYLKACPRRTVARSEYQEIARAIFVEKTRSRVDALQRSAVKETMDQVCCLNGWKDLKTFSCFALDCLEQAVATDDMNELCFSHGDLFFANMLFDPQAGTFKLIDPRGSNGRDTFSCELPLWYDLAKLSHSFLGHYDLMVYDLMDVVMQPDLRLSLRSSVVPGLHRLGECFTSMLRRMGIPLQRVRIFEGALFLSMIPLHSESPLRMQRQLIRAMELFQQREGSQWR